MLIKNLRYIVTMDPKRKLIKNGAIFIEGNKIKDIGKSEEISGKYKTDDVIDGKGMVALPGLIKAHTHSPMTLMRGYADDLPLMEWLQKKIWPLEAKLKPKDCYYGSLLACLELTSFGVTSFSDMYFYPNEIMRAVKESCLRAMISPVIYEVREGCGVKEAKKFLRNKSEMITPALGPHSTYACSKDYLKEVKEVAEETGAKIHIHTSETKEEVKQIKEKYGMKPVEFLDSLGLLTDKTFLAQVIWVSDDEIKMIAKAGAKVVHCPISNMKLASGVAPVSKMKNITVSLGSDGPCSNNNLDMFEEMKAAALLHKIHNMDPTVIPAQQALEMATVNGAKALGLEDVGSLEIGKKADLILVDFRKPHLTPLYNPVSSLVYACNGADVDTTICNGKVLMRNRKLVTDAEDVMKKVEEIKEDLMNR